MFTFYLNLGLVIIAVFSQCHSRVLIVLFSYICNVCADNAIYFSARKSIMVQWCCKICSPHYAFSLYFVASIVLYTDTWVDCLVCEIPTEMLIGSTMPWHH